MNEQYTYISQVYDQMIEIDYSRWGNFIKNYFIENKVDIKNKSCLELACGTGNMTLELKKLGFSVTAVDISEDMLGVAEKKIRQKNYNVNFINGDMTEINFNKKFDNVFAFCDGYNYILEEDDILKSFNMVYNHLVDGGSFIFDISTKNKLINIIGNESFTLNREDLCYIWDNYYEKDLIEMYISFFVKEGELYRRFDEVHFQKAYEINYIKRALENIGFESVKIYNDYENLPVEESSLRAVFIAKK